MKEVKTKKAPKERRLKSAKKPYKQGVYFLYFTKERKKAPYRTGATMRKYIYTNSSRLLTTIVKIRRQKLPGSVFDMKFA